MPRSALLGPFFLQCANSFLSKEVAAAGIEPTNPKFRSPPQPSGLLTDHQSLIALSSSAWCQLLIQLCWNGSTANCSSFRPPWWPPKKTWRNVSERKKKGGKHDILISYICSIIGLSLDHNFWTVWYWEDFHSCWLVGIQRYRSSD